MPARGAVFPARLEIVEHLHDARGRQLLLVDRPRSPAPRPLLAAPAISSDERIGLAIGERPESVIGCPRASGALLDDCG